MSLNMRHGMDQSKVAKYGKLFGTIDFEFNEDLNSDTIERKYSNSPVGLFIIDNKEFPVTLNELDRIIETAENAKSVFLKSYSMGRYNR